MPTFDVEHQDRAYGLVQRALFAERLPHAYIFHGPHGVGKETFALGSARVLLCHQCETRPGPGGRPLLEACGRCTDCHTCRAGTHPDLHLIHRQLLKYHPEADVRKRKGLDLGVDVIRHFVIERVGTKPVQGRAKVFIIREADLMNTAAQNALLKTLEEPPNTTFLILLVSSLDELLPTTRSRCQLIPFATLPEDFIAQRLGRLLPDMPDDRARQLARLAQGSLGLAVQYAQDRLEECNARLVGTLGQLPTLTVAEVTERLAEEAKTLGECYAQRDPDITDTEATRRGLKALLFLAAAWYRDLLHAGCGSTALVTNVGQADELGAAARRCPSDQAISAIGHLSAAERELDLNVNTKLCLDNLVIHLEKGCQDYFLQKKVSG